MGNCIFCRKKKPLSENGKGTLDCYDLWEKYEFNTVSKTVAEKNLKEFKGIITLTLGNVIGVERNYNYGVLYLH